MNIGLTYTHIPSQFGKILPNYLYLLEKAYRPVDGVVDQALMPQIHKEISSGMLEKKLLDAKYGVHFENPMIREIMSEAYPYEVLFKFLSEDVPNDIERNERLIGLFNEFFDVNYHETIRSYCESCNTTNLFEHSLAYHERTYDDMAKAIYQFTHFIDLLLQDQGFFHEADACARFIKNNVRFAQEQGISGVTIDAGDTILIKVGNQTYATLFHELVHAVNTFFREKFDHASKHAVCFDQLTKTNEGLANFVAYHCYDAIQSCMLDMLDELDTQPRYFSAYMDVYATLYTRGSNNPETNFQIVHDEMQKFEGGLFSKQKAEFYYERFFKYFHYHQHTYLYPKELMYHIGYQTIREMFAESGNPRELLVQSLLGTVCL